MPRGIPKKQAEQANGQGISKWEAVQRALSTLGNDATPLQIKEYIKSHFHMDLETSLISNYKSSMLKKGAGKSSGSGKAKSQAAARAGRSGGITVDDIKAVKEVVDRLGADKVLELAHVLSK
jgi:ribosomal protein L19E